jgi:hypothetical protein
MPRSEEPSETPSFEPVPVSTRRLAGNATGGRIPWPVVVGGRVKELSVTPGTAEPGEDPVHRGRRA